MPYSGRVSVDVDKQPHILVNEEVGSDNKQRQKGMSTNIRLLSWPFVKKKVDCILIKAVCKI